MIADRLDSLACTDNPPRPRIRHCVGDIAERAVHSCSCTIAIRTSPTVYASAFRGARTPQALAGVAVNSVQPSILISGLCRQGDKSHTSDKTLPHRAIVELTVGTTLSARGGSGRSLSR